MGSAFGRWISPKLGTKSASDARFTGRLQLSSAPLVDSAGLYSTRVVPDPSPTNSWLMRGCQHTAVAGTPTPSGTRYAGWSWPARQELGWGALSGVGHAARDRVQCPSAHQPQTVHVPLSARFQNSSSALSSPPGLTLVPATSVLVSGEKSRPAVASRVGTPPSVRTGLFSRRRSHTRTVSSIPRVARVCPSRPHRSRVTAPAWAARTLRSGRVNLARVCHSCSDPSSHPHMTAFAVTVKAQQVTGTRVLLALRARITAELTRSPKLRRPLTFHSRIVLSWPQERNDCGPGQRGAGQ